jgi:hypothetical protein
MRGVWWYRTDKETKRDGKGEGRLSIIIVPKIAANPTRGEPKCIISPDSAPHYRFIRHPKIAAFGTLKSSDSALFC